MMFAMTRRLICGGGQYGGRWTRADALASLARAEANEAAKKAAKGPELWPGKRPRWPGLRPMRWTICSGLVAKTVKGTSVAALTEANEVNTVFRAKAAKAVKAASVVALAEVAKIPKKYRTNFVLFNFTSSLTSFSEMP